MASRGGPGMTEPTDMSFNPRSWLDLDDDAGSIAPGGRAEAPAPSHPVPQVPSRLLAATGAAALILVAGGAAAFMTRTAPPAATTDLAARAPG